MISNFLKNDFTCLVEDKSYDEELAEKAGNYADDCYDDYQDSKMDI